MIIPWRFAPRSGCLERWELVGTPWTLERRDYAPRWRVLEGGQMRGLRHDFSDACQAAELAAGFRS